jgi:hypothetical protein
VLVEIREAVDHRLRFLRRRGVIEPDQRLAAIDPLLKDREVFFDGMRVERKPDGSACRRGQRAEVEFEEL